MLSEATVSDYLTGSGIPIDSELGATPLERALQVFHNVLIRDGKLAAMSREVRLGMLERGGRLGGIFSVVADRRMPDRALFGPLHLATGDNETDYDVARHYILRTTAASTQTPAPGFFYPEVRMLPPEERVIRLALAHVGCKPTSRRSQNLHSLAGRQTAADALKAAQPFGTTCALFLKAVLVSAGDGRFIRHPDRLGIGNPARGNMAHGMGAELPAASGDGLRTVGRAKGDPQGIRRGDLYFITAQEQTPSGTWQESGHVGLIAEARPAGDRIEVVTVDGGQKEGDEVWSGGRGWYTKRKTGLIRRHQGVWEKLSRDRHGVLVPPQVSVSRIVPPGQKGGAPTTESKQGRRKLVNWISLAEVAGGFVHPALRIGGRYVETVL